MVDVAGTLGAVGVAGLATAGNSSEAGSTAGDTLAEGDDAGLALADAVDGPGAVGTGSPAGTLEVEEAGETAGAGASAVAGGAGVGTAGADAAAGTDGRVLAAGAVVVGRAGGAAGAAVDALLGPVVEELVRQAALLADRPGLHISAGAADAVLRVVAAPVAALGAGDAEALEAELVLATLDGAAAVD